MFQFDKVTNGLYIWRVLKGPGLKSSGTYRRFLSHSRVYGSLVFPKNKVKNVIIRLPYIINMAPYTEIIKRHHTAALKTSNGLHGNIHYKTE